MKLMKEKKERKNLVSLFRSSFFLFFVESAEEKDFMLQESDESVGDSETIRERAGRALK